LATHLPTKTYHMFVPRTLDLDSYFESAHTRRPERPKPMSYLMDVIRRDTSGTYQGVIFLVSNRKFRLTDAQLGYIGITRKELEALVKEFAAQ
jgi:hypothetical protein